LDERYSKELFFEDDIGPPLNKIQGQEKSYFPVGPIESLGAASAFEYEWIYLSF